MAEIIKMYKEQLPAARLIGKRYTDEDRINGSFGAKWGEWFQNKWFHEIVGDLGVIEGDFGSYLGAMRVLNCKYEYWIGTAFPPDTPVADGFEYVDIDGLDMVTFWIYGDEKSGELYGLEMHNSCLAELKKNGFAPKKDDWCIERYTCPRFTSPDEKGNVILDYCISVE